MAKYIPYDYNQSSMVVINFNDQIQTGTFEHAVHHLVDNKLDLSLFDQVYKNDDNGRPAYDPAILLKIILFAYSKGITSSREIAWCCRSNIIFMALSCQSTPHFTTIAEFISGHCKAVESLFEQVLLVCDEQGLLGNELFAIDGCKMPSNAAKEWSGTHKELAAKRDKIKRLIKHHTKKHQQQDLLDDENDAEATLQSNRHQQAIETLNKAADKIEAFLDNNEPRMGKGKRKTEVKSNITDNESAKMTTSKGTIQGYNGIASVDKKHQIIIGADAFFLLHKHNEPTHTDWMKERVDSDKGKQFYSHRMSVVKPVFGNLESNKKLTRFTLRGLKKVNAQWKLFCLIQNIEKLANYGTLAP